MSLLCPSALASLDESLAVAYESLRKIEAAESIDVTEVITQFETAAESARKLRAAVSSELPHATWENREELDAIIENKKSNGNKWYFSFLRRTKQQ